MKILMRWFLLACALVLVAQLGVGVEVRSYSSALWAALVLGLLNALLRPVLVLLTLPVTLLTLGLFILVINAWVFQVAAHVLDGLVVRGFMAALLGSVIYSLCAIVIDAAMQAVWGPRRPKA